MDDNPTADRRVSRPFPAWCMVAGEEHQAQRMHQELGWYDHRRQLVGRPDDPVEVALSWTEEPAAHGADDEPIVITLLQWPSPATTDGLTQPFWAGINDKGSGTNLITGMIVTAFVPPAAGILGAIGKAKGFSWADTYNDYGVPILCCLSGIANTVVSSIYAHDQAVSPVNITFGVLGNVSYIVAPLGLPALKAMFADSPAVAKAIVDVVANFGTAGAMGDQAIAAGIKPLTDRIPL